MEIGQMCFLCFRGKLREGESAFLGSQSVVVDLEFELGYDLRSNILSTTAAIWN